MAVTDITLDRAYLAAIWLETLFYGMNIVLFSSCLYVLIARRRTPRVNRYLVGIAVLMFCFSTCHVFLGFYRLIMGFIVLRNQPGGPAAFFSDVSIPANVAKVGLHTVNSIVGDSVVVWRCFLVWGRSWKMCLIPMLLVCASAICGFGQTVYFARGQKYHSAFAPALVRWNGSLFSLSLATNMVVTILVALRAWHMLRLSGGAAGFRYFKILIIIIESGMIYSVALICEVTLYFLGLNSFYIVYDPIGQLTGIVPTMIIILAGLELTSNDVQSRFSRTQQLSLSAPRFRPGNTTTTDGSTAADDARSIPLDTMQFASVDSTFSKRKSAPGLAVDKFDDPELGETKTVLITPLDERTAE
ncbi:hypothetical protein DAEQUDRAFT_761897 [Daedalea quercina L-15889]|uniref:Integral membrane protein n=1 Tax=Daedalea quercina L-15889 TaxID=1314783 RepID=A0A165TU85_9APHY|nr:hypothetical protein DAEQUDRAFT_761897 [Daedalea quercina L-15889]